MTIYSLLLRTDIGVSSGIVEAELLLDVAFDARNEPWKFLKINFFGLAMFSCDGHQIVKG